MARIIGDDLEVTGATHLDGSLLVDGVATISGYAKKTGTPVAGRVASWNDANTVQDGGIAASDVALKSAANAFAVGQGINGFVDVPSGYGLRTSSFDSIANGGVLTVAAWQGQTVLVVLQTGTSTGVCFAWVRASTGPFCTIVFQPGTVFEASTAVLTGSTGTSGKITISGTNNIAYIENRSGSAISIRYIRLI